MPHNMLSDALKQNAGLRHQLDKNLIGVNGPEWADELKKFLRKEVCWAKNKPHDGLTLLSKGESLTIGACDGDLILAHANETFTSRIDHAFVEVASDKRRSKTEETPVEVYEITADANFRKMFTSISPCLSILYFTQSQIIKFVEKYPNWLCSSGANLFLFKAFDDFFVAVVRMEEDGMSVVFREFGYEDVWAAQCKHRLIVPGELPLK